MGSARASENHEKTMKKNARGHGLKRLGVSLHGEPDSGVFPAMNLPGLHAKSSP
jgi:hypothetical protein